MYLFQIAVDFYYVRVGGRGGAGEGWGNLYCKDTVGISTVIPPPHEYSWNFNCTRTAPLSSSPSTAPPLTHAHVWYIKLPIFFYPLLGPLEGVGPENLDIFKPKWHSLRSWQFQGPKKSRFSGPTPSNGPRNGCSAHQNHFVQPLINKRYINS